MSNNAELYIYEEIDPLFGIGAADFVKKLNNLGRVSQIDVRINSPGGSYFEALGIMNALRNHPAEITTYVDGLAASAASVIMMAGDKRVIADNGMVMIHLPLAGVYGNAGELRAVADLLEKITGDSLVPTYIKATGLSDADILTMLEAETWLSAKEAFDLKFVTEVASAKEVVTNLPDKFVKAYKKTPQALLNTKLPDKDQQLAESPTSIAYFEQRMRLLDLFAA